jgi:hypothetical protein
MYLNPSLSIIRKSSFISSYVGYVSFNGLYRDFNNPIEKGLMIDTYFLKVDDSLDMKLKSYDFYIFLVDDYLVSKSDLKNINYDNSLFISYTKNITSLSGFDNSKLYLNSEKDNLELGLFTFLAEKLYEQNKLTLFLSHNSLYVQMV